MCARFKMCVCMCVCVCTFAEVSFGPNQQPSRIRKMKQMSRNFSKKKKVCFFLVVSFLGFFLKKLNSGQTDNDVKKKLLLI